METKVSVHNSCSCLLALSLAVVAEITKSLDDPVGWPMRTAHSSTDPMFSLVVYTGNSYPTTIESEGNEQKACTFNY